MLDIPVAPHLEIVRAADGMAIRAFVPATPPRLLTWQMKLTSQTSGGSNSVTQGGKASGDGTAAVAVVRISRDSRGTATLRVLDGEREVARDSIDFDATPGN